MHTSLAVQASTCSIGRQDCRIRYLTLSLCHLRSGMESLSYVSTFLMAVLLMSQAASLSIHLVSPLQSLSASTEIVFRCKPRPIQARAVRQSPTLGRLISARHARTNASMIEVICWNTASFPTDSRRRYGTEDNRVRRNAIA